MYKSEKKKRKIQLKCKERLKMELLNKIIYWEKERSKEIAIKVDGKEITYEQLYIEICRYRKIIENNIKYIGNEQGVIIYMNRSIEFIVSMLPKWYSSLKLTCVLPSSK